MNILFVLYHDMSCNSAAHVDGLCRALTLAGHACSVAVPNEPTRESLYTERPYRVMTYAQAMEENWNAKNARFDIVHAWTPREVVRKCCMHLVKDRSVRLCIHLEDNESELTLAQLGPLRRDFYRYGLEENNFPDHLSHPIHAANFLARADGITVLIDKLASEVPFGKPSTTIWPSSDDRIFFPRAPDTTLRRELGVPEGATMLCYHGNVHASNWAEVRSLYLAAALLRREKHETWIVRIGRDYIEADPDYHRWASEFTSTLGFVEDRERLGRIVAEADILVQPGRPDAFNDFRFPSKLTDFFASGKPVVLPRTNIGLVTRHAEEAWVLDKADGISIAEAISRIQSDPELHSRLSHGARNFYLRHLQWPTAAAQVTALYEALHSAPEQLDKIV